MKYLLVLLAFPVLSAGECGKKKNSATADAKQESDSLPSCLRNMIEKAKTDTPPTIPIQIDEYLQGGKTVYYVTADCCDFYNVVYDDSCKYICAPGGGFTGKGDEKCPNFFKEAKHVKLLWKQEGK